VVEQTFPRPTSAEQTFQQATLNCARVGVCVVQGFAPKDANFLLGHGPPKDRCRDVARRRALVFVPRHVGHPRKLPRALREKPEGTNRGACFTSVRAPERPFCKLNYKSETLHAATCSALLHPGTFWSHGGAFATALITLMDC
jgi:hypothetical protein